MNKSIKAADFSKKPFTKPLMKAVKMDAASVICASGESSTVTGPKTQTEEYTVATNFNWF